MTTTTITLPATVLAGIAQLAVFTPQKKSDADMTPIIAQVQVTLTNVERTGDSTDEHRIGVVAIATDRYLLGEYRTEFMADPATADACADEPFSFLLPAAALKSLKLTAADVQFAANWTVIIEARERAEHHRSQYTESTVTIRNPRRGLTANAPAGDYPHVARLLPELGADLEPLSPVYTLNVTHIARIATVRDPLDLKTPSPTGNAWRLHGTGESESGKPMPVLWERDYSNGHAYRVLQQPNLILR